MLCNFLSGRNVVPENLEATIPYTNEKECHNVHVVPTTENNISLLETYSTKLTSFALRRIKNGKPFEKVFWAFGMLFIICLTCYTLYRNTVRYFEYGVRTEIRSIETRERSLPVITFCLTSTFLNNFFCYKNNSFHPYHKCKKYDTNETSMEYLDGVTNGIWKPGKYLGNHCYALNENGTMKLATGTGRQRVIFEAQSRNDTLFVTFQTPEEFRKRKEMTYITEFNSLMWLKKGYNEIHIEEKQISRIADPYAPGCTNTNMESNRFSDTYTYDSCLETCAYDNMLKECHDVVDMWKKYRAPNSEPPHGSTFNSTKKCLAMVAVQEALEVIPNCSCKRACEETAYTGWYIPFDSNDKKRLFGT